MKNKFYPRLFEPLQVGTMFLPNRIAMVPTDISSANAALTLEKDSVLNANDALIADFRRV